jgi:hypothetical protein
MLKEIPEDKQFTTWRINSEQWESSERRKENISAECLLKLVDSGARSEHTPRKSPNRLPQGAGVSKSNGRTATQLLMLRPCKTAFLNLWSAMMGQVVRKQT